MSYTKLFSSIITSTIWSEDDKTRIVWITMLALADKNGEIQGSVPGLARIAGVSVDNTRAAITRFLSPDLDSRTKDDEGRRIEVIDGGWSLLNHRKYRNMASDADRAEKAAIRQQRKRDKDKRNKVTPASHGSHASVTPESHQNPQAEAEAEADTKAKMEEKRREDSPPPDFERPTQEKINPKRMVTHEQIMKFAKSQPMPITDECCDAFFDRMEAEGWITPKGFPLADWQPRFRSWVTNWANNSAGRKP